MTNCLQNVTVSVAVHYNQFKETQVSNNLPEIQMSEMEITRLFWRLRNTLHSDFFPDALDLFIKFKDHLGRSGIKDFKRMADELNIPEDVMVNIFIMAYREINQNAEMNKVARSFSLWESLSNKYKRFYLMKKFQKEN